jgi:hypothetical protein
MNFLHHTSRGISLSFNFWAETPARCLLMMLLKFISPCAKPLKIHQQTLLQSLDIRESGLTDAIVGVSLFSNSDPADLGRFDLSFVVLFNILSGETWCGDLAEVCV